ncbi:hypothetical protein [Xanthomonas perforans]|uniref:hypothetical protein n=1 Tax=Xanthomonas perforans TaxID=442694 RepID=UPI0023594225|nr:hypothetical protein [Xanthomonas perforans]MDC9654375.1 hypothetical protein [Xanthomonas perforans]
MHTHTLYNPAKIIRRADGTFTHPDLPTTGDETFQELEALIDVQGYAAAFVDGSDALSEEAHDQGGELYFKELAAWNPSAPAGEGWLLASIDDTENGPAAIFVRAYSRTQPVTGPQEPRAGERLLAERANWAVPAARAAFDQGAAAYHTGLTLDACPYASELQPNGDAACRTAWRAGWNAAAAAAQV